MYWQIAAPPTHTVAQSGARSRRRERAVLAKSCRLTERWTPAAKRRERRRERRVDRHSVKQPLQPNGGTNAGRVLRSSELDLTALKLGLARVPPEARVARRRRGLRDRKDPVLGRRRPRPAPIRFRAVGNERRRTRRAGGLRVGSRRGRARQAVWSVRLRTRNRRESDGERGVPQHPRSPPCAISGHVRAPSARGHAPDPCLQSQCRRQSRVLRSPPLRRAPAGRLPRRPSSWRRKGEPSAPQGRPR
jgi:hypothetical protein